MTATKTKAHALPLPLREGAGGGGGAIAVASVIESAFCLKSQRRAARQQASPTRSFTE